MHLTQTTFFLKGAVDLQGCTSHGGTWHHVLICLCVLVDVINDICIDLLSPGGMENSLNNIFYHPRVCEMPPKLNM